MRCVFCGAGPWAMKETRAGWRCGSCRSAAWKGDGAGRGFRFYDDWTKGRCRRVRVPSGAMLAEGERRSDSWEE